MSVFDFNSLQDFGHTFSATQKRMVFLTNNFTLPALTIAHLYKCRWRVELFFKWIKQYLRIKAFFGTSQNAVKTQIWIAISVYLLVVILKRELKIDRSFGEILQILSITFFGKDKPGRAQHRLSLKTPNKAPQDVKDKHVSTLCSATW